MCVYLFYVHTTIYIHTESIYLCVLPQKIYIDYANIVPKNT